MSNKPGALLTEEQRKAIDTEANQPLTDSLGFNIRMDDETSNPEGRKSEIRDNFGSASDLGEALDDIRADLLRIRDFHVDIEYPEGSHDEWVNWVLPNVHEQIEKLKLVLEKWEAYAESTQFEEDKQEIEEIIMYELFEFDKPDGVPLVWDSSAEFVVQRKEALHYILDHNHPQAIWRLLDEIVETPGVTISGKEKIGGNNRKWHANKRLKSDFGLIEWFGSGEWDNQFEPTDRGNAVHATIEALLESNVINQMMETGYDDEFKTAKKAVSRYSEIV